MAEEVVKWLNPPAPDEDVRIMDAHEAELAVTLALAYSIEAATGVRPYRLLIPVRWGLGFSSVHALYRGLIVEKAQCAAPMLAYVAP